LTIGNIVNVTCNGFCNGSAQGTATGGTAPYTYSISPTGVINVATGFASGLCAGVYTVTVTDTKGCTSTASFTITEPSIFSITNVVVQDPLCAGNNNGTITVSTSGGTGLPSFTLSPVLGVQGPSGTFTGLTGGTYTVTGVDGNGCSVTTAVVLTDPLGIAWTTATATNISCYGAGDGKIEVSASGGVGTIVYTISPLIAQPLVGHFNPIATAQCYTVTATDNNGCFITTVLCIAEPAPITFNAPIVQDNLCHGGVSGGITISVNGGTPPFTYTLNPGAQVNNTGTFTGLGAGSYTVMVSDSNGCSSTSQAILISEPQAIVFNTVNVHEVYCYGEATGSIAVVASGGTGLISFSISPSGTQLPLGFFKYLVAGTYTITATDANGCTLTTTSLITENPRLHITDLSIVEPICAYDSTGVIQATGVGGVAPIMYSLNNGLPNLTGTFTGLMIGQYKLTLIDNLGCSHDTLVDLTGPTLVGANIRIENTKCIDSEDGRVFVEGTGGRGGYKYFITPGLHINKTGLFFDLGAGTYTLRVVDTVGCEYQTTITVNPPLNPLGSMMSKQDLSCYGRGNEGSATVSAFGGQLPYVYEWNTSPVQNTATAKDLYFGWYYVQVTDANGCVVRDSVYVEEGPCCDVTMIPNAFSPNGDNVNDEFKIMTTAGIELIQLEIYDRWGQRVWSSVDWRRGWDGRIDGQDADMGNYFYVFRYRCTRDGKTYIKKGDVMLVR